MRLKISRLNPFGYLFFLLLLSGITSLGAQSIQLGGVVRSATDGEPVIGAAVIIKGTTTGVTTLADGTFSINAAPGSVLTVSCLGFMPKDVAVDNETFLTILLDEDRLTIEEVVAVGYRTERKSDLTGAISIVKVDEMMSAAENNPIKALQGRVPGMMVTGDGNPSGAATIRIRGEGTFNDNDPLLVIDGVATKGGMHELNSNDIESIQILKDASAASIYGSRAANGVIIITTKRGAKGEPRFNFDSYVTGSFYGSRMKVLNASQYGEAMWRAAMYSGDDPNANNIGYRYQWNYDTDDNPYLQNILLPQYIDSQRTMLTSDTDWFDRITRTGFMQSYNFSASNGNEHGSYYLSSGYLKNDGLVRYTDFSRFSTRLNSDFKFFGGKVIIGENLTVNRTTEVQAPGGILDAALKSLPIIPVHTESGGWGGPTNGMQDRHNPMRLLYDNKDNNYTFWRIFGNAYLSIEPVSNLILKSSFGVDYGNFYKRTMTHSYKTGIIESDKSSMEQLQTHSMKWTWTNTATYAKTWDKHSINVLGGFEMYEQQDLDFTAYKDGFIVETPEQMWHNMGVGTSLASGDASGYTLLSYFGNLSYNFADRYLASFTIRHDGSSRFGKNNRFATFPAVSAGWRISNEQFMESSRRWLSDLKLRTSWGQTGNQEIGNYVTRTLYTTDYGLGDPTWGGLSGTAYDFLGNGSGQLSSGYKQIQRGNPNLKWETTTQTNIGVDFGLFNQRLYGSLEVYRKDTRDILINPPYIGVIGEGGSKWYNGASMRNQGVEFQLGYRGALGDLSYDVIGNISAYRNKVTKLPSEVENSYGGNGLGDNILGRPIGSFYGYIADGIFRTQEEVDAHADQPGKAVGRIRYRDLDNSGTIDDRDRTWIGKIHPDFTWGLNLSLQYKAFDMMVFFNGVQEVDVNTYDVKSQTDFWSVNDTRSNKGRRLLGAWSVDNPNSSIPALQATNTNDEGRFSTYYVENGSYMKLRNIQLGYTLPSSLSQKIRIEKLRFYVSGQNLFTVKSKRFTGIDPENALFGYPIPVTCTFGINLSF